MTVDLDAGTSAFSEPAASSRSVALEDQVKETSMIVYPNPASEHFSLLIEDLETKGELHIYDMTGSLVYKQDVSELTSKINIDADALPYNSGIYVIMLNTGTQVLTERVVVNK